MRAPRRHAGVGSWARTTAARGSRFRPAATKPANGSRTSPPSALSAPRRRAASPEIGTLDLASLERFQTDLIEAGFEPRAGDCRVWLGPIAESLTALTAATTMRIVFAY